ncbi:uncharacterized protein LOC112589293 [Harpegnathos saltator]|uniref:uncharacterized protein LOC112589293 n=1 Tax=Harpegnathos saltator TaxID=610380 RepID=UPI000DBEEE4E|nr:uncharacterized protein LOC112589293 [Harpegnathos saltator]
MSKEEDILGLIELQYDRQHRMERLLDNARKSGQLKSVGGLTSRLQVLDTYWAQFQDDHRTIRASRLKTVRESDYVRQDACGTVQEVYIAQRAEIQTLLDGLKVQEAESAAHAVPAQAVVPEASLPRIPIPKFEGKFDEWRNFKDLFESLIVDNPSLASVHRMHYLKQSVSGEPERLLRHYGVATGSFEQAWEALCARYDNRRLLVDQHLDAFRDIGPMRQESVSEVRRLLDRASELRAALRLLDQPVDAWDVILVNILRSKLDSATRRAWEMATADRREPVSWDRLAVFLDERRVALEAVAAAPSIGDGPRASSASERTSRRSLHLHRPKPTRCAECGSEHGLRECTAFKDRPVSSRRARAATCPSKGRCRKCGEPHQSLLHSARQSPAPALGKAPVTAHAATRMPAQRILLATARVCLMASDGRSAVARALIDQGSEVSLVSEALAQRLRASRRSLDVGLSGVSEGPPQRVRTSTSLRLRATAGLPFSTTVEALILPRLTAYYPPQRARLTGKWSHLRNLRLADDHDDDERIEAILGAEVFAEIVLTGLRRGPRGAPIAQRTRLGWVLFGALPSAAGAGGSHCHVVQCASDNMADLLRRFWEVEEIPVASQLSEEERACEEFFAASFRRRADGRYQVRLPFRSPPTELPLGDTRRIATASLHRLERRLLRQPSLGGAYRDFLDDYERQGHMIRLPLNVETPRPSYFIPHHPVIKQAPELKVRVVFNASQASTNGRSLNDLVHVGPRLQRELGEILLAWRMHRVAFSADIEQMFRQVRVAPEDQHLQQILWRDSQTQAISVYRLTTVTYGMACAPYLAIRTLHQLALDERERYPRAADLLCRQTYADDILAGADDLGEARHRQRELSSLLMAGGFRLRKWAVSHPELLSGIPGGDREPLVPLPDPGAVGASVLGVGWIPVEDAFYFSVNPGAPSTISKRGILSVVARLYDPLGWLGPMVVLAKILLQDLWLAGLGWDEALPSPLSRWDAFSTGLAEVSAIRVPRWTGWSPEVEIQLYGFSDASERAYAAVIYLRARRSDGTTRVALLASKTRVAPLKRVSLPRLELCGAQLLSRLMKAIVEALGCAEAPLVCWTDSSVTLHWITGHPSRWTTFVANRVSYIHESLPRASWRHVPSGDNPADCASRGLLAGGLREHALWWRGLSWLVEDPAGWPGLTCVAVDRSICEERRMVHVVAVNPEDWSGVLRACSFRKTIRVMAYMRRFLRVPRISGPLTADELSEARLRLLRITQHRFFAEELGRLKRGGALMVGSALRPLNPMMDERGLLRVGGRLQFSALPIDARQPVLLPRRSRLATLVVRDAHERTLHGGVQLTLLTVRREFWIPAGRSLVRQVIRGCVRCTRHKGTPITPFMAPLPRDRVLPHPPFSATGVDYAGPVAVRPSRGRGRTTSKGYIAVFVCFSTCAVHLEVVSDYSAPTFLAAFHRFAARQGLPVTVYSDRGTTFVGADRELRGQFEAVMALGGPVAASLSNQGTTWKFMPPSAPHFGGLWEAGVRSVKYHLRRVIGEQALTFEEFATLLARIEACLNSRPLCPLTDDPQDLESLTPGHFLIRRPLLCPPERSLGDVQVARLSRWQLLQHMTEHLWERWSREYLAQLQVRGKWLVASRPLDIGDLVILADSRFPPTRWPLGRITGLLPGPDRHVRVAQVRTADSTLTRPLVKLVRLPVDPKGAHPNQPST